MFKSAKTLFFCSSLLVFSASAVAQETTSVAGDSAEPSSAADVRNDDARNDAVRTDAGQAPSDDGKLDADVAGAAQTSENTGTLPAADDAGAEKTEQSENPQILTDALLDKQLREVSTNLDTLKEDTFTTKSRLLLLREEVLQRSVGGSRFLLRHKNDMGGQYELVQVYYAIDRAPVYSKQDPTGDLDDLDDEVLYDRFIAPGAHQLSVFYVYKGKKWGIFTYMQEYTFRVESSYDFIVEEGKSAELVVTASEQGGVFDPYEQRPGVEFDFQQFDLIPDAEDNSDSASSDSASSDSASSDTGEQS